MWQQWSSGLRAGSTVLTTLQGVQPSGCTGAAFRAPGAAPRGKGVGELGLWERAPAARPVAIGTWKGKFHQSMSTQELEAVMARRAAVGQSLLGDIYTRLDTGLASLLQPSLTSRAGAGGALGASCPSHSWGWLPTPLGSPPRQPEPASLQKHPKSLEATLCLLLLGSTGKSLAPSSFPSITPELPSSSSCSRCSHLFGIALTLSWTPGATSLLQEAPAWPGCCIHSSPHLMGGRSPLPPSSPASGKGCHSLTQVTPRILLSLVSLSSCSWTPVIRNYFMNLEGSVSF